MSYFFGFAGIPREIRDKVEAKNSVYAKGAGFCIDTMPGYCAYSQKNVDFFLKRFEQQIVGNTDKKDTSFAIIYLVRDEPSTSFFVDAFFPHALMVPVVWGWDVSKMNSAGRLANELSEKLKQATALARDVFSTLKDEVRSRASSTAVLLPLRNFKSSILVSSLKTLHAELGGGYMPREAVLRHNKNVVGEHPMRQIEGRQRSCFVDDRNVEFHPPGNDRHGFARAGGGHPLQCLLAGMRRLGAPYDPLFHYDCTKGSRPLKGEFYGCHHPLGAREGNPHLNIAPNDHVRA